MNIPLIDIGRLPLAVQTTLKLIFKGGPFPYRQDGITFKNREGLLPVQSAGYYQEYTVPTSGVSDRGKQRLIVGQHQEIYYTGDHYNNFYEVLFGKKEN